MSLSFWNTDLVRMPSMTPPLFSSSLIFQFSLLCKPFLKKLKYNLQSCVRFRCTTRWFSSLHSFSDSFPILQVLNIVRCAIQFSLSCTWLSSHKIKVYKIPQVLQEVPLLSPGLCTEWPLYLYPSGKWGHASLPSLGSHLWVISLQIYSHFAFCHYVILWKSWIHNFS